MYRRIFIGLFSLSMLSLLLFVGSCQGQGKKVSKESGTAATSKAAPKEDSLDNYKTAGRFDPSKLFTDINAKPVKNSMPTGLKGDPDKGRKTFSNTKTGNCAACHCTDDSQGCGNIGVSLIKYRSRLGADKKQKTDDWLFQVIADRRNFNKITVMPPSLPTKVLSEEDIVNVIAYLNTLK